MKIISGRFKNHIIPTIKNPKYRPSTGKLKEAMFSALQSLDKGFFADKVVLDLFAGTGSLGFESLSRGASHVTFVDIEPVHLKILKEFALKINELQNLNFLRLDASNLPMSRSQYDIVFIDPPYSKRMANKSLESLRLKSWLKADAIVVVEIESDEKLMLHSCYDIINERTIGRAKLIILRYNNATV